MFTKPFDLLIFFVILKLGYVSATTQITNILCTGTIQEFTSENGTITSYNYPNQYTDNLSCEFRISVKSDEIINVKFETFATEATHDVLKIYDGYNTSSSLIGSYSGTYTEYGIPSRISSISNYLFLNFTTDSSTTKNGFKLNYKSIKKVSFENLTDSQGIIRSPEYPNKYPGGINYSWKISAPPNYSIILEFNNFQTEHLHDFLEIIELSNNKQITVVEYSGSVKPDRFLSNTNELILKFTSDRNIEVKGFEIHYQFAKAVNTLISQPIPVSTLNTNILCERGIQEFTSGNGTITSFDYPNKYASNLNCQFRIGVNSDETILVNFETFATEANRDILMIYNGRYSTSGLISSYSGNQLPPRITSTSNYLYFYFTTDNSYTENGFKLNYKSIKKVEIINLTESEGIIKTPEYPNNYTRNLNYTWKITAPANKLISVEFNNFDIEDIHDTLEIIEVSDNKSTLLSKYSGSVRPENILSSSNEVILRFTSDFGTERKGFEISYKFIAPDNYSINRPTPLNGQNSNILCGSRIQEFTSQNATITSYNYPDNYANNLNCQFRIVVEIDKIIIVDFETFLTEATHDILKIYNGPYKTSGLYNSYGGNELPSRIVSTSNSLYFNFKTDSGTTKSGFKLNYKSIKKVSVVNLTQSGGIIQSPEYPSNYSRGISYTWRITAPANNLIILEFNDFNTEANHDVLQTIEVLNNKSTSLTKYSGSVKPEEFLSYSNELVLLFTSDESYERKGFEISYKFIKTGLDPKLLIQTPYSLIPAGFDENVEPNIYQAHNSEFQIQRQNTEGHFAYWELLHQYSKYFEMSLVTLSQDKTDSQSVRYMSFYNSYLKELHIISNNSLDIIKDSVGAIVYDWNNDLLIWTDIENRLIKIIKINETKSEFIFNNTIQSITNQMLINTEKSVLIWTTLGHNPRIIETNFDGSNQSVIYNNSKQVTHLTIDYENQRYYFIDIKDYSLYSIDFSGKNETFYMRSEDLFHINNMFVWNNNLYLSNKQLVYKLQDIDMKIMKAEILYYSYEYYKMERDFKIENKYFYKRNSKLINRFDFQSIIPLEYKSITSNKCSSNQCSHLCLPIPNGYQCVCPSNYLLVNENNCIEINEQTTMTTVQTTLPLNQELITRKSEVEINEEHNHLKFDDKIHQIMNELHNPHNGTDELVEKFNSLKLEMQNKLGLESSSDTNINKLSITNFILILLLIIFNIFILYYAFKKKTSIQMVYYKRKENKLPLLVLNDCENDDTNTYIQNSMDNPVFSRS